MSDHVQYLISQNLDIAQICNDYGVRDIIEQYTQQVAAHCAAICYHTNFVDGDAHASNILYEFNVDDCRKDT